MKILVTGSIAYDVLLGYDGSFADALTGNDLEHLSVSFFSPHFARHHGGTGANIAWNLKLLLQDPLLVGTVGSDGGAYTALLEERGIATERIEVLRDHVTATAIIGTDTAERQITFFHPGADSHGSWPDLSDDRDDVSFGLVGARDALLMMQAVRWFESAKVPFLFDPGQQVLALSGDELLSAVRASAGVVVNAYEFGMLADTLKLSTEEILKHTPFLIVTHGEEGLTLTTKKKSEVIPACPAERLVNPTGAGDALRAGLLTGLAAKWPLRECARLGASVASFVVEHEGTLLDYLDINDVLTRAELTYGERLPEIL